MNSTMFTLDDMQAQTAKLKVFGIGGGGGNALENMIIANIHGVDFVAANTDAQAIAQSSAANKIQLGIDTTRGLGAGSNPNIGREAAELERDRIREALTNTDMVFITAGMGGGTGTGGAPVVAEIAKELDILTVAVITKPFLFEGNRRMRQAEAGIDELRKHVDTLITIPNQKLIGAVGKNTSCLDAFKLVDNVLLQAVRGIAELITNTGHINADFADVCTVMKESRGLAMMGCGSASGEGRACEAADLAISSPLLEDIDLHGAQGLLVNVTGSSDMSLHEYSEIISTIQNMAEDNANVICGMVTDDSLEDEIRVTVVATGLGCDTESQPKPKAIQGNRDQIEIPPVTRIQQKAVTDVPASSAGQKKRFATGQEQDQYDEETLKVPTWIRWQAD